MATWDEDLFRGGTLGLVFGLVGGSMMGALYVLDVAPEANVPWQALLVHAYTAACIAGAVPMAVTEAARDRAFAPLARTVTLVVTGALVGLFGVTHIATLPDTPYPGPALATMTLLLAAVGFSAYAQPRAMRAHVKLALALVPLLLIAPALVAAGGLVRDSGVLGLESLTRAANALGLSQLGLVGGALGGGAVGAYGEVTVALAKLMESLRARRGSEIATNR